MTASIDSGDGHARTGWHSPSVSLSLYFAKSKKPFLANRGTAAMRGCSNFHKITHSALSTSPNLNAQCLAACHGERRRVPSYRGPPQGEMSIFRARHAPPSTLTFRAKPSPRRPFLLHNIPECRTDRRTFSHPSTATRREFDNRNRKNEQNHPSSD